MKPRTLVILAIAGMIGPTLFVALVIVQGMLQPDYSHIAMPISALAAWPLGWLQNLNFFMLAALNAALALGLHQVIRPTRFGVIGIALLLASSGGLMLAGVFPWINVNGVPTETPAHVAGAVTTFLGASTAFIALSRRTAADPSWRGLSAYMFSTGVVMLIMFVVVGFFAVDAGTPFHDWAGLLQRVLVTVWVAGQLVAARRMVGIARQNSFSSVSTRAASTP